MQSDDNNKESKIDRRAFLKGAAVAGAAVASVAGATRIAAAADNATESAKPAGKPKAAKKMPIETFITHPGSDFMPDVLKKIGLQ